MTPAHLPPKFDSIVDVIGCTPMVELHRLVADQRVEGRLLVKLEHLNPGHSKKDRIALEMLRRAKADGALADGQTVVELTSGNTGTGLAIACAAMGHPFVAVMSRGNSVERARMMAALGAEVVLVDQEPGAQEGKVSGADLARVERRARELTVERGAFRCDQFNLAGNALAHERHTGPEMWRQADGQVDALVDFAGTGGTFTGIMRYLRRVSPTVRGYLVEPSGAAALAGQPVTRPGHAIQGGGYSLGDLPLLDRGLVTDYLQVTDDEAIAGARLLARVEGVFAGYSTGAHVAAALNLLRTCERGATLAFLACDTGLKYLSTGLY